MTQLSDNYDIVVGNSFGGFFAYILGFQLDIKTILTNPCIPPANYIPKLVDNYKYENELVELWSRYNKTNIHCSVLLGRSDEVLDTSVTLNNLNIFHTKVETISGGHSLKGDEYQKWFEGELT